ncbi:MAG: protein kinase [Candidatus Hydrogenedentes bacterium]|nr:protein kinase [Candidatus Hydrogenedentota bacterium]
MGVVYLAEDTRLRRNVALKILSGTLSHDAGFRERFEKEARSIASLDHPNIVRVHAFESLDGLLAIEMELVEGGSLADQLATKGLTAGEVAQFAYHVLDALRCCHDEGLIHRDIKPTNILIDRFGAAKLTDFGLATILEGHLEYSMRGSGSSVFFMGTPRYAPPEAWDSHEPSPSWDVYALGTVMYEALTGRTPYEATTPMALVKEMATRRVAPLQEAAPHVSQELAELISVMMNADADRRPNSAQDAIDRLRAAPEFLHPQDPRSMTIVARRAPRSRVQSLMKRVRHVRLSAYHGFLAGLLLALAVLYFSIPVGDDHGSPVQSDRDPISADATPATQASYLWDVLPSPDNLPGLLKWDPGYASVYDVWRQNTDSKYPASLLTIQEGGDFDPLRAYAVFEGSIWGLSIRHEQDRLRVEGGWAEYRNPSGSTLRMGAIGGSAQWLEPGQSLLMSLEFTDDQTNSKWTETVSLNRSVPTTTGTEFLLRLEALPLQQPLLYNELVPRGLGWANSLDALLPAISGARTRVPRLPSDGPEITVDGALDESVWSHRFLDDSGTIGVLNGLPGRLGARMNVHASDKQLRIGIVIPREDADRDQLALALCKSFSTPRSETMWWRMVYDPDTGLTADQLVGNRVQPWSCDWNVAAQSAESRLTLEIAIPFSNLGDGQPPRSPQQWRINASVRRLANPANPVPVVVWGYPELENLQHGAILQF